MAPTREPVERCHGCGLAVAGGTAGCRKLFEELVGRDFGDAVRFGVHRMLVDTYALQHPDAYCASAKSLAAHLMGLCWILEHDGNRATGSEALRRWLDGNPRLERPEPPAARGARTIAEVLTAEDATAHHASVERWARSTWEAWKPLHELAREWVRQALAGKRPQRR